MVPVPLAGHGLARILYAVSTDGQTVGGFAADNTTHLVDAFVCIAPTGFTVLPERFHVDVVLCLRNKPRRIQGCRRREHQQEFSRATLWDPLTVNRSVGNSAGYNTSRKR